METDKNKAEIGQHKAGIGENKTPIRRSLLAKKLLISGENRREFDIFRSDLLKELFPRTKIEDLLAEKFIVCAWRLQRVTIVEKHLLNSQNAITEDERNDFAYDDGPRRKRIRNIKRVDLAKDEARYLAQQHIELQKVMNKTLERLRAEQRLRDLRAAAL